jgi:hypothetical protein
MTCRNTHAAACVSNLRTLAGTLTLVLLGGCAGGATSHAEEVGKSSQALQCVGDENNGDCPWRYWSPLCPQNDCSNDIIHTAAPALCYTPAGYLVVSVDTNAQYRVLQFTFSLMGPAWDVFDDTSAWLSKPACALREDDAPGQPGFLVAGKYLDNYIYVEPGTMAPFAYPQQNPVWDGWYDLVSGPYSTGGIPAMASQMDDSGNGATVVVYMGDDGRTIYGNAHVLPYTQNGWQSNVTGPVLPYRWAAVGAPAIASMGGGVFQIVVHAHNRRLSQDALFQTYFFADDNQNTFFSNQSGSPAISWTQLKESLAAGTFTIDDDPALTLSTLGPTVYFRSGQQIYQTTGYPLGSNPVLALSTSMMGDNVVASAPAATGGHTLDQGTNVFIARTVFDQIYYAESFSDGLLEP